MPAPAPSRVEFPFAPVDGNPGAGLWLTEASLTISIDPSPARPAISTQDEARWAAMRAANPRLHDGPILSVMSVDAPSATIRCVRDSYKRLALSLDTPDAPWLLGVKGWITGRSADGEDHLLLAWRSPNTRFYPNLWECAPAGGVNPSSDTATLLPFDHIVSSLRGEGAEELGLDMSDMVFRCLGIYIDPVARSYDVFLSAFMLNTINPLRSPLCSHATDNWEYTDAAWLARSDAPAFIARSSSAISAPTLTMLRALHWA